MNFKAKCKRFFTLSRSAEGFTLVELIVVIAILGILSGIGIPMYSKYIEKANIAVDNQNLAMLHNMFVVSCVENSVDPANVEVTSIKWTEDTKTFTGLDTVAVSGEASAAYYFRRSGGETPVGTKIVNSFNEYLGTEGVKFKSKDIDKDAIIDGIKTGEGIATESGTNTFTNIFDSFKNDATFQGYVSNVKNSTFGAIGAEGLMNKMNEVTGLAAGLLEGATDGSAAQSLLEALSADYSVIASSMGLKDEELAAIINEQGDAYWDKILANYAVLQVANTTSGKTSSALLADLQKGSSKNEIVTMLASGESNSSKEGVAKAAMMYAMYTAYAENLEDGEEKTKAIANLKDISTFANAIEGETQTGTGFMNYLSDPNSSATADMDGFLASMNIINSSTQGNEEATRDLLENGYGNTDLVTALESLLGD